MAESRLASREGTPSPHDAVVREYLEGRQAAHRRIDHWIRTELEIGFPVLAPEVDDLCQTIHGKLIEIFRRGAFRGQSALKTFVVRVTRYTAVDQIRLRYRDPLWSGILEPGFTLGATPYRTLISLEKGQLLRQILMLASRECRELWRMAFVDQMGYGEIAKRMSISPGTVKSRMWRCRQRVIALLGRLSDRRHTIDH